jgi:CHAT domain-containing protein
MKRIQLTYLSSLWLFLGCQKRPTADEAHQKGIQYYHLAGDAERYNIRQQWADSAIYYFKQELELRTPELGQNHWRTHKVQLNVGVIYQNDRFDLNSAQNYYELALFDAQTDTNGMAQGAPFLKAEILYNLGSALERLGDYQMAESYALQSDSLFKALGVWTQADNSNDFKDYLNNLLNLGDIYAALKNPLAIQYYDQVHRIARQRTIPDYIDLAAVVNRGIAYRLVNQLVRAEKDLLQALKLSQKTDYSANIYIELAKLYLAKAQYSRAETHAKQALTLRRDSMNYPKGHAVLAEIHTTLGQIYLKINQLEEAKKAFQDALGDEKAKSYRSNWQIEALTQLADLQSIQEAAQTYETLSERLYERKSYFKTDAAKLDITKQARITYEKSIHLNHQLFGKTKDNKYLNRILTDMERSKAVLLSEMIQDTRIKNYDGVPDTVRTKERNLKLAVAQAERKVRQDTTHFQQNNLDLSTKYSEWQAFVQQLKQKQPKYYRLKHAEPQLLEIQTVQNQLPDSALLVDYYLTENILHILAMNKAFSKSYEIPLTKPFDTVYNRYQRIIAQKNWDLNDLNQNKLFSAAAHELYQYLLEQPLTDFKTHCKDLIIIPDDKLAGLSFAALFTKAHLLDDKHHEPYLILEYSVNMAYTLEETGILNENVAKKAKYVYAGLSHDFKIPLQTVAKTKVLSNLSESKTHIEQINHLFKKKGLTFTDSMMTLKQFKTVVQQSCVTELVSHGGFDEHDARQAIIAFPNLKGMDWLEIKDVYNLDCAVNELLMLIACETGRGVPVKGETVVSMGYAFAYSGCKRRVAALWSIPHERSMNIMASFFKNLSNNKTLTAAKALQKAQKDFLRPKKPISAMYQTPNLWAGLTLSGNIRAYSN